MLDNAHLDVRKPDGRNRLRYDFALLQMNLEWNGIGK